jgi:hypothetical protein
MPIRFAVNAQSIPDAPDADKKNKKPVPERAIYRR